ncbi:transcriptional regulator [Microbacterium sp. 1.5R]|uniref:helix-turn-helix transcriptional regulator n=1 Tax=Microbacterium TaxID=33882 RepID=UPI00069DC4DC|nr:MULTISPECIES: helix-turn-helix transcriptional regulator [unclassified Microbacterium]AKV85686.1 XRE family transcriptional regulator [Microbacterium sp. CGR1]APH45108.1 transcriptional regulator [Microbacterium sp. 1.5R]KRD52314.1 XRE family transcriptional regulator [Microbacterium sp. Root280D1]MBC6494799.1 XRE family transcriptional regulator [Microbacterium sp. 4-7]MDY0982937.1 helix-turn-helix transcriptional regulator [Microbacterium sp. CFBP9023]
MDREALAEFLVRRREQLKPSDVGLGAGARRRTPGLRREEVAQLAAMSTDYYARLEQQRGPQPSVQILGSLARALRLTPDERDYLHRVCGHSAPDRTIFTDYVHPGMLRVLDRLHDTPAFVVSALDEVLIQNDAARALLGDASGLEGIERSGIYRWFAHPDDERRRYPEEDHPRHSRVLVASLRSAYGALGERSRAGEIVRELASLSPEFAQLWEVHEVRRRFEDHKVLIHPEIGPIEVDCQALFTEDESQALIVLTAAPGSDAESKLELLRVLGTQRV